MNKKILVIDDEESIRILYHDEFSQAGYLVRTAATGEEALELVSQDPPDLITLDIKMSGMDGIHFLRMLRENFGPIPVIISTAYGEFKHDFSVWASDAYVTKSADMSTLLRTVDSLLT
ncbi:response regulator [bacterium]|nr:response regulator [bacterium]